MSRQDNAVAVQLENSRRIIHAECVLIAGIDMPEHAGRIIMIIKIQLAACFLEHIRRRPGMFPIGHIDNPVQFPAPAMKSWSAPDPFQNRYRR